MANFIILNEEDVPGAKLSKDPTACDMEELKRWLECHGLKKSGKREILVERVRHSIGKIKVDPKIDGGKWYNLKNNRDSNIIRD